MSQARRVQNKIAIVTGGTSGIGRATSLLLAREGAKVAVVGIEEKEGNEVVQQIESEKGSACFWRLDVSSEKEVEKVFKEIVSAFGALHILVNNAGVLGANKPTHLLTEDEWDAVMNVNVKGVFLCTKHAVLAMRRSGGGSIINLSSIYGLVGAADNPPYRASKGAVRLMSKTDALMYAKDNIRVNSVHPGAIRTRLLEDSLKLHGDLEEGKKTMAKRHPLNRLGEPEDIAYGILYLASDESKFVTGSELVIDGGYTAQ